MADINVIIQAVSTISWLFPLSAPSQGEFPPIQIVIIYQQIINTPYPIGKHSGNFDLAEDDEAKGNK